MVEAGSSLNCCARRKPLVRFLTSAWECRRFGSEREALAWAQVYARLPNAEAVVAYAYAPEGRKIIFDWNVKLGRRAKLARRTRQ
jgi:hypothetical protein